MRALARWFAVWLWLGAGAALAGGPAPIRPASDRVPNALYEYVGRPDPTFAWQTRQTLDLDQGRLYDVDLRSQTWQGITWRHALRIHEPKRLQHPRHVVLLIAGGSNDRRPGEETLQTGFALAKLCAARVAVLHQVPNQPLLGGRKEDDLITETWLRFLRTGQPDWPLLLPMVKSAVRAMDAVEAIAAKHWEEPVAGFVLTGGSKRGWTTWLSAAADKRVVAIAPMVINVLNFRPQMQHQLDTWGAYSEQIADYSRKGLTELLVNTPDDDSREALLRRMMDPYTYRQRLTLPKLVVNGTNDPYWVVDATRFYWDDLVGPKYLLEVPNAGHGLDGGRELAYRTVAALVRHCASGTPMPQLEWEHASGQEGFLLKVRSRPKPAAAHLWVAQSPTKDFRKAQWHSRPMEQQADALVGQVARPRQGHVALFGQMHFEFQGLPYCLSTTVRWY
ncbi:MAG: PhoPQ-activated pathogenicity-related family protein [Thermoguttaceae bacterium]